MCALVYSRHSPTCDLKLCHSPRIGTCVPFPEAGGPSRTAFTPSSFFVFQYENGNHGILQTQPNTKMHNVNKVRNSTMKVPCPIYTVPYTRSLANHRAWKSVVIRWLSCSFANGTGSHTCLPCMHSVRTPQWSIFFLNFFTKKTVMLA